MTTTDTDALTERIARALNDEGWTFEGVHEPGDYDECEDCRRAVAPIAARITEEIAAEVRNAQADAWDEGCTAAEQYYKRTVVGVPGSDPIPAPLNPHKAGGRL